MKRQRQSEGKAKAKQKQNESNAKAKQRQNKRTASKAKTKKRWQNEGKANVKPENCHLEPFWGLCWSNVGGILAQLAPSWGYLGTLYGLVWGHLGFLRTILSHLGGILGPRAAVPRVRHLGPLWVPFWGPKFDYFCLLLGSFFGPVFRYFLDHFGGHFGHPFWDQIGPRGGKMSPRGPSRPSKSQKAASSKTLKNPVFEGFWVQRPPKRASRGPRRLPRGTQRAPKPKKYCSQNGPQLKNFWTRAILGVFLGLELAPKLVQNRFHF